MTATITYLGDLRTQAEHISSGSGLITDAPVDNHGKGQAFSPTDLVVAAHASCMLTLMGIAARTHGIDMDGTRADALKVMAAAPRRIARIETVIFFPPEKNYSSKERAILENAARTCPVALSLHPDVAQDISFVWPEP
jgi:putative redox protein